MSHQHGSHVENQNILAPISKVDPSQSAVLFCGTPVVHYFVCAGYTWWWSHFIYLLILGGCTEGGRSSILLWREKGLSAERKSFSWDSQIISGLSMTVAAGSVYALLGPSGCGKTTLLSCVLGRSASWWNFVSAFRGEGETYNEVIMNNKTNNPDVPEISTSGVRCRAPCRSNKILSRKKPLEGSVEVLGGKPGDRRHGLPGNLCYWFYHPPIFPYSWFARQLFWLIFCQETS